MIFCHLPVPLPPPQPPLPSRPSSAPPSLSPAPPTAPASEPLSAAPSPPAAPVASSPPRAPTSPSVIQSFRFVRCFIVLLVVINEFSFTCSSKNRLCISRSSSSVGCGSRIECGSLHLKHKCNAYLNHIFVVLCKTCKLSCTELRETMVFGLRDPSSRPPLAKGASSRNPGSGLLHISAYLVSALFPNSIGPVKVLLGGGDRMADGFLHAESPHHFLESAAVALHPRAVPVAAQGRLQRVLERRRGRQAFSLARGCAIRYPDLPTFRPWPCLPRPDLRSGDPPSARPK